MNPNMDKRKPNSSSNRVVVSRQTSKEEKIKHDVKSTKPKLLSCKLSDTSSKTAPQSEKSKPKSEAIQRLCNSSGYEEEPKRQATSKSEPGCRPKSINDKTLSQEKKQTSKPDSAHSESPLDRKIARAKKRYEKYKKDNEKHGSLCGPNHPLMTMSRNFIEQTHSLKFICTACECIAYVLSERGWARINRRRTDWNLFWGDCNQMMTIVKNNKDLTDKQRIAHIPDEYQLCTKNNLARNLKEYRLRTKSTVRPTSRTENFFPITFELPNEYLQFQEYYGQHPDLVWILKPSAGCRGKGIFLFQKFSDFLAWNKECSIKRGTAHVDLTGRVKPLVPAVKSRTYVVQKYIVNPYLISNGKFDLRLYVLVPSVKPLEIWVYREGITRFALPNYDANNLRFLNLHLTNTSLHKTSKEFKMKVPELNWSLTHLRQKLMHRQREGKKSSEIIRETNRLFEDINEIIVKSLLAVSSHLDHNEHCFGVYGYDIIIDCRLKPWLLEVNGSPNLLGVTKGDGDIKENMVTDVFNLLDMEGQLRVTKEEKQVGGFDLIWKNDKPIYSDEAIREGFGTSAVGIPYNRFNALLQLKSKGKWRYLYELREAERAAADAMFVAKDTVAKDAKDSKISQPAVRKKKIGLSKSAVEAKAHKKFLGFELKKD